MSEMVEHVAKAIFMAGMSMHSPISWEKCNKGQRENVRRQAHAAIKAMREPTQVMIETVVAVLRKEVEFHDTYPPTQSELEEVAQHLIDAVLGKTEGTN